MNFVTKCSNITKLPDKGNTSVNQYPVSLLNQLIFCSHILGFYKYSPLKKAKPNKLLQLVHERRGQEEDWEQTLHTYIQGRAAKLGLTDFF